MFCKSTNTVDVNTMRSDVKGTPQTVWFDEECKVATVKSSDVWTDIGKEYNNILYREENKII